MGGYRIWFYAPAALHERTLFAEDFLDSDANASTGFFHLLLTVVFYFMFWTVVSLFLLNRLNFWCKFGLNKCSFQQFCVAGRLVVCVC